MQKRYLIIIGTILAGLGALYYFVSPLLMQRKEPTMVQSTFQIADNLYSMDAKTTEEYNKQILSANDAPPKSLNETLPDATLTLLGRGQLQARAHNVEGTVALLKVGDNKILRFEDLETLNGPELHIYLATDLTVKEYVDLGKIRATRGNVNYPVPASADTAKYRHVLIWSEPFKIIFSYAELK